MSSINSTLATAIATLDIAPNDLARYIAEIDTLRNALNVSEKERILVENENKVLKEENSNLQLKLEACEEELQSSNELLHSAFDGAYD